MRSVGVIWIVFVAWLLGSCIYEHELALPCTDRVLVVYLAGDNNLSGEAYEKLDAIRAGFSRFSATDGADSPIRVVVYLDTRRESPLLCEVEASGDLQVLERYEAENSASSEVFGRVLRAVRARFPSRSYSLLLFSHASGWLPGGRLAAPVQPGDEEQIAQGISCATRSILLDETNEMEISDFSSAIPDGMFDAIVFEACLMAGVEVAWELRGKCDYLLASSAEILSPGFTEVYKSSLGYLLNSSTRGAEAGMEAFARTVCDDVQSYAATDWRCSFTCSVIRPAALEPLADFIRTRCDLTRTVDITQIQRFDRGNYRLFFDLYDYFSQLLDNGEERSELSSLISAAVPWRYATDNFLPGRGGFEIKVCSGLTTYIQQPEYRYLNWRYEKIGWRKELKMEK